MVPLGCWGKCRSLLGAGPRPWSSSTPPLIRPHRCGVIKGGAGCGSGLEGLEQRARHTALWNSASIIHVRKSIIQLLSLGLGLSRWGSWFGSVPWPWRGTETLWGDWAGCRPLRWSVFSSPDPAHSKAVSLSSWSNRGQTVELIGGVSFPQVLQSKRRHFHFYVKPFINKTVFILFFKVTANIHMHVFYFTNFPRDESDS